MTYRHIEKSLKPSSNHIATVNLGESSSEDCSEFLRVRGSTSLRCRAIVQRFLVPGRFCSEHTYRIRETVTSVEAAAPPTQVHGREQF
jgi:hypothetical protein